MAVAAAVTVVSAAAAVVTPVVVAVVEVLLQDLLEKSLDLLPLLPALVVPVPAINTWINWFLNKPS